MRKSKKVVALLLATVMLGSMFTGCGKKNNTSNTNDTKSTNDTKQEESSTSDSSTDTSTKKVDSIYFLNFKPEVAEVYEKIAKDYEAETGIKVKVNTAAAGTYETTLKSEIAKKDAPTIFQLNGPVGYQNWKDYCADMKGSDLYSHLTDKSLAVTEGEGVYGVPYAVEGYGIIYNNAIMDKYFALTDRATTVASMAEINNFATLKAVVEDMQARKADLGIDGVFASTSMGTGEQWRWQTHLANLPLYYEFKDNTSYDSTVLAGLAANEIEFKYAENFKNIYDLYINNSCVEKGLLGAKTVNDSMADFALGKAAMVQNGNWAWGQINSVDGNTVAESDIKFMPIYTGMAGEETQGLCVGTENYFAINSQVSEEKQQASLDFLNWLFTSDTGKAYVTNDLGFIAPFDSFSDAEKPSDPLSKEVLAWMEKDTTSVVWTFAAFPSEEFKNMFGDALLEYVQGGLDWEKVVTVVQNAWKSEREQ